MQNCTDSRTLRLIHLNQTWTFPLNEITVKVPICTKHGLFSILFTSSLYDLTSELEFIKCRDQNMAVLLT